MCLVGVTEGVSWGELAAEPASFALPEFSGMAMKEALASTGPLVTSTFASACSHSTLESEACFVDHFHLCSVPPGGPGVG